MLSRSGFSIRRLVSQRRPQTTDDEDDSYEHDEIAQLKAANKQIKTDKSQQRLLGRNPTSTARRRPKEPIIIRRTQSVHKISEPLPPLPFLDEAAHSSASSLCSCDCVVDIPARTSSRGQKDALCLSHSKGIDSTSLTAECQTDDRRVANPRLSSRRSMRSLTPTSSPRSKPNSPRIRTPERPPRPSRDTLDSDSERLSDNVQQLIREADQAFKEVGTAIAKARLTPSNFEILDKTTPPPSEQQALKPQTSPFRSVLVKQDTRTVPSPLASPTRNASVSKPKRRSKKHRRRNSTGKRQANKRQPRWTLSENVTEIFTGQFFRRIEADEMLTPSRIQELRASREAERRPRSSTGTVGTGDSDGSETPIEPFHLEDLPSRVQAAGVKTTVSPIDPKPPIVSFDEVIRRDFSVERRRPKPLPLEDATTVSKEEGPMTFKCLDFPSPPLKNPLRFISRPQMPLLPTIPEVLATIPQDAAPAAPQTKQISEKAFVPAEEDNFIFLQSTPCTVTMPTFRHGRIRFTKEDINKEMKFVADDTLDWTAFQMAILGGAGYFFSESEDFTQQSDAEEMDELVSWFNSFGFDNPGLLIPSGEPARGASPATTAAEYSPVSSTATDSTDLPIPVAQEHPNGFWNEGDFDASKFYSLGTGIKRWTVEGHPKKYHRESTGSLPQSPMMNLVVDQAAEDGEIVPMGYNLGHDLGDFLKWEAEHVYAGAFFGSN